jgi:hypothetical protein
MKPIQTEIVRSYSRTIQIAQYEPASFFSSYKEVYDKPLTEKEKEDISDRLYETAKLDVEVEVAKFKKPDMILRARLKEYLNKNNAIQ